MKTEQKKVYVGLFKAIENGVNFYLSDDREEDGQYRICHDGRVWDKIEEWVIEVDVE